MTDQDLLYFEGLLQQYGQEMNKSLIEKRQSQFKSDPLEELKEVYEEVKEMESSFKKVLDVCSKSNSLIIPYSSLYKTYLTRRTNNVCI